MHRRMLTILFLVGLMLAGNEPISAQTCTPAPIGLVAHWSGDGNTLDARSRYDGTIQGNVTFTAGQKGQALNLGGANGDRVTLGSANRLASNEFTIEGWVKRSSAVTVTNSPSGGSPSGIIFSYGLNGYAIFIDDGTGKIGLTQIGVSQILSPTLAVTDTNWHHIAVTYKGIPFTGGSFATFYVDGVADSAVGYAPNFSFSTNAAIGTRGDGSTDNAFFGAIDELGGYSRALEASEIQAIYNAGTAGKCSPVATIAPDDHVFWLSGDGDATDNVGNLNGTLDNGASITSGRIDQAFSFDGADDQITVPNSTTFDGGSSFTIEGWINPTSLPHGGTIFQKRTAGNTGGYVLELTQPSGGGAANGLQFVIMIGGIYRTVNPGNVVNSGVWQHVAATYDGAFMRIYVNGSLVGSTAQSGAVDAVSAPVIIGRNASNGVGFPGKIDELSFYRRALTLAEIQSISLAGAAGKTKIQSTVPLNAAAWYPGDGNTTDLLAANNGTLQGGAAYGIGKVGRAFSLNGTTAYVSAPSSPANDPTGAVNGASMEAWVYFNQRPSDAGHQFYIMSKTGTGAGEGFDIHVDPDNAFKVAWGGGNVGYSGVSVQTGVWYHVVAAYSSPNQLVTFYVNGERLGTQFTGGARTPSGVPLDIGHSSALGGNRFFDGLIDEPTVYDRELTREEVRDLFYAGTGGKYKGGSNLAAKVGSSTITFGSVTRGGAVERQPVSLAQFATQPVATDTGINFDAATTAVYTSPGVCLNVPSFTAPQFNNLRLFHFEAGAWQNRTAGSNTYPTICSAGLSSLSPFALGAITPTAAESSVGGRVMAGKNGISNALVTISGGNLTSPVSVRTNQFGAYRFDDLAVGQVYTLTVSSRKHTFEQNTLIVNLLDEIADADFRASSR